MSAAWAVMMSAQAESPAIPLPAEAQMDLWFYRDRTVALLKRYARASVEVGRLPSLLGRECFRSRITSYSMTSFEDLVIFVHDVESALGRLDRFHQRLIAMSVFEEFSLPEVARLLPSPLRTVEREVPEALDTLSCMFLEGGLLRAIGNSGSNPRLSRG